ncbi:MAG: MarC family protein [Vulcanimicrobiaceae bacterium]
MIRIEYVAAILFLALGPLGVVPVFYERTKHADTAYRVRAAVYATLIAAGVIAVVAVLGAGVLQNWQVSVAALDITIGILLMRGTFAALSHIEKVLQQIGSPEASAPARLESAAALAFSPIAVPTIVSPTGVVTVALFLTLAQNAPPLRNGIYVVIGFLLLLDLVAMIFAGFIITWVRMPTLAIIGWIFAALQATLAVEVTLRGYPTAALERL